MSTFREKYLKYGGSESPHPNLNTWEAKYLKYKMKYIQLKNQLGGKCVCGPTESNVNCPKCSKLEAGPEPVSSSADMSNPVFVAASQPASSSASSAAAGNPVAQASSSAAAGNPDMINIVVLPMTGAAVVEDVFNRNMTIWELKQIIGRDPRFPVDRQRIIYRPGPHGINALEDLLTLDQSINNTPQGADYYEFDLLLGKPSFNGMFNNGLFERIVQLNKDRDIEGLVDLLSEYEGKLVFGFGFDSFTRIDVSPLLIALKRNRTVTGLNLSMCNFDYVSALAVADMLRENNTITSLVLPSDRLSNEAVTALVAALRVNNGVRHLIYNKTIESHLNYSAIELANMLRENTRLTHIDLSGIGFNGEAATALAAALRHNTTLTHVILRHIRTSDAEDIELCNALRDNANTHIIEIDLTSNGIGQSAATRDALQNLRTAQPQITIIA